MIVKYLMEVSLLDTKVNKNIPSTIYLYSNEIFLRKDIGLLVDNINKTFYLSYQKEYSKSKLKEISIIILNHEHFIYSDKN